MTDSFRQKVEEILGWIAYGRLQPDKEGNPEQVQVSVEIATDAIMLLVKGIVPAEQTYDVGWGGMNLEEQKDEAAVHGFNLARKQILTKLES